MRHDGERAAAAGAGGERLRYGCEWAAIAGKGGAGSHGRRFRLWQDKTPQQIHPGCLHRGEVIMYTEERSARAIRGHKVLEKNH